MPTQPAASLNPPSNGLCPPTSVAKEKSSQLQQDIPAPRAGSPEPARCGTIVARNDQLEHDPRKWVSAFRERSCPIKKIERDRAAIRDRGAKVWAISLEGCDAHRLFNRNDKAGRPLRILASTVVSLSLAH